jgi:hypothetical protein
VGFSETAEIEEDANELGKMSFFGSAVRWGRTCDWRHEIAHAIAFSGDWKIEAATMSDKPHSR